MTQNDAFAARRPGRAGDKVAAYQPDLPAAPIRPEHRAVQRSAPSSRHASLCERPAVSVVLGSLDRLKLLRPAIDSVRSETASLGGEIIVIDGGSSDGSIEWLSAQPDVITIIQRNRFQKDGRSFRRRSWGAFMNIAFRAAAGRQVLMISDDCLLAPGSVSGALERVAEAEKAGLKVGACAFYFRDWPHEEQYYVQRTIGGNLMVNHGLYAKEALEAVNYANEDDYVFYKADTDLSLRIWAAGYAIIDSPKSICEHYIGVDEPLRASNNLVLEHDRQQMRRLWPDQVSKAGVGKMGKIWLPTQPGTLAARTWQGIRDEELSRQAGQGGKRR